MTYWRMQLHPAVPERAAFYAAQSLSAGFIGLDFDVEVGDLMRTSQDRLPQNQRDYWAFAHQMAVGDKVLIIVHHFPFALVVVKGEYNYIRQPVEELGVWFRHFRAIRDVRYYADWITDARAWQSIKMADAISPLVDPSSESRRLIDGWP